MKKIVDVCQACFFVYKIEDYCCSRCHPRFKEQLSHLKERISGPVHYLDLATNIVFFKKLFGLSERAMSKALGCSSSKIGRSMMIGQLSPELREAARLFGTDQYVLVKYCMNKESKEFEEGILNGTIRRYKQTYQFKCGSNGNEKRS